MTSLAQSLAGCRRFADSDRPMNTIKFAMAVLHNTLLGSFLCSSLENKERNFVFHMEPLRLRQSQSNKWVAEVMKTSRALDLEKGIFALNDPCKIAFSLKKSAERSDRRKGTPLSSAMSMLNFYINRAGRNLNPNRRDILERAKVELRRLFSQETKGIRRSISRFHVMAVLQSARAVALGLEIDEAKSWGLNRALFYAAAKQGWSRAKREGVRYPIISEFERSKKSHDPIYVLGGEKAFRTRDFSQGLRFRFGEKIQYPEDFDRQIKDKFGGDWITAWKEALQIIQRVNRRDLDIQSRFFNRVYVPNRDQLAEKWSTMGLNILKQASHRVLKKHAA